MVFGEGFCIDSFLYKLMNKNYKVCLLRTTEFNIDNISISIKKHQDNLTAVNVNLSVKNMFILKIFLF